MENNQLAVKQQTTGIERVKNYLLSSEVKDRFSEMMGASGIYYLNQVMIVVANNEKLQKCEPQSILISAMRAASLRLSVDASQGHAWIIPYWNSKKEVFEAQFQIGYKGVYELAIRTGLYRFINVFPIHEGEAVKENRFTGMHEVIGTRTGDRVIGRMLYFQLLKGYEKTFYMTVEQISDHAKHYSPKNYADPKSKWNDPYERPKMEDKTVLINGLRKWGKFGQSDLDVLNAIEAEDGRFVVEIPDEGEVTPPAPRAPMTEDEITSKLYGDPAPKKEPEPQPEPAPQPEPEPEEEQEPSKSVRPYAPEIVKQGIEHKTKGHLGKIVSDKQRSLAAMLMGKLYEDDTRRHAAQKYLTGTASIKDMQPSSILALLDWLKPSQDSGGDYIPDPMASKEAQAIYDAAIISQGQQPLF